MIVRIFKEFDTGSSTLEQPEKKGHFLKRNALFIKELFYCSAILHCLTATLSDISATILASSCEAPSSLAEL